MPSSRAGGVFELVTARSPRLCWTTIAGPQLAGAMQDNPCQKTSLESSSASSELSWKS